MNKKTILKKKQKKEDTVVASSPFYGIKGSINKITEEGNHYVVTRYNINGSEGEKQYVPKKRKNALMDNYINDITKYLEINNNKYKMNLSKQSKKQLSKKKTIITSTTLCSLTAASTIGIFLSSGTLLYAWSATFIMTLIASCHEVNELKKCLKEEKIQKFIHQYRSYVKKVNDYNIEKDKTKKSSNTKYTSIKNQKENKVIDIEKKKILSQKVS